jgi:hypothetical protein
MIQEYNIYLDDPPYKRFNNMIKDNIKLLEDTLDKMLLFIAEYLSEPVLKCMIALFDTLSLCMNSEFIDEIKGIHTSLNNNKYSLGLILGCQYFLEISALCTTIIARKSNNQLFMFHTLDWEPRILKKSLFNLKFFKHRSDRIPIYEGQSCIGCTGLFFGLNNIQKYVVCINSRNNNISKLDIFTTFMKKSFKPLNTCAYGLRRVLETSSSSNNAVYLLQTMPIYIPVYYCYMNDIEPTTNDVNAYPNNTSRIIARTAGEGILSVSYEEILSRDYLIQTNIDYPYNAYDMTKKPDKNGHSIERIKVVNEIIPLILRKCNKNIVTYEEILMRICQYPILCYYTLSANIICFDIDKQSSRIITFVPCSDLLNSKVKFNDSDYSFSTI